MPRRKSKQPRGNMPLTYGEKAKLLRAYGTNSVRLGTDSQIKFGDCCLSLTKAEDPVITPSGHIYSRESIVSYLLTKTQELRQAKLKYDAQISADCLKKSQEEKKECVKAAQIFLLKDQGSTHLSKEDHSSTFVKSLKRKIDTESKPTGKEKLQKSSYWLSEAQPQYTVESHEEVIRMNPPPERPSSPMSGEPLRLKNLIPIKLQRDESNTLDPKCLCAVSNKAITTQSVIVIKKTGIVILKDVYDKIVKPSMVCPITGKKIKEKDVVNLNKCATGFAASGEVVAKKYKPTLT
mmetsp:Transcript_2148/g.2577  ORF Transcript_2148/g.2577 Transcript_2148/m.2577 type:complete len:293 (-) Transcript_2148:4211-5089(-)